MMQAVSQISSSTPNWKNISNSKISINNNNNNNNNSRIVEAEAVSKKSARDSSPVDSEPTSTLDTTTRRSPNSPTSTFSSFGTAAGLADRHRSDNAGGGGVAEVAIGMEEWDSMFPNNDGALLPWIMGESDDLGLGLKHLLQSGNPNVEFEGNAGLGVVDQTSHSNLGFSGVNLANSSINGLNSNSNLVGSISGSDKPQILNPQLMTMMMMNPNPNPNQSQSITNPNFSIPQLDYCHQLEQLHYLQPQAKRHNPGVSVAFDHGGHGFLLRKHKQQQFFQQSTTVNQQNQQQFQEQVIIKDQILKAANQIQTGNFSLAQEILARLNHHFSNTSSSSKLPFIRATLYVKEALQMLLLMSINTVSSPNPKNLTPFDIVHKINAFKEFSDVSPVPQFVNFTCTQAILEAFDDDDVTDCIHIIDFDIGCGALWASFIQELPLRKRGAPCLKITTVASLSNTHPFELSIVRENLIQFANDIGVSLEIQVVNLDLFDQSSSSSIPNVRMSENESIAVSIPIWATSYRPSILSSILRFIKQRSPKIILSMDRGFDRYDTPFPQHLIHTLESTTNFLESLDGVNLTSDMVTKFEKFFIQPRIENTVLGRVHSPDKLPHWKTLFASAGLLPLQFSNFTETQADYVVKRNPRRGFNVEKRQASLVLSWQRKEVVTVSAWRC